MPQRDPLPGKALSRFHCGTRFSLVGRRVGEGRRQPEETHQVAEKAVVARSNKSHLNPPQTTHRLAGKCVSRRGRGEGCPFSPLARYFCLHSPALVSNSLPDTTEKQIPSKKSVQKTSAIAEFASRLFSANLSDSPQECRTCPRVVRT